MGVFRQFPYSNFHEMNMDEIIKIVKDMLEEWAQYHAEWDAWMEEINDDWSNYQEVMNEAWQNMQDFINNYFDNLDVQNEINNKITSMVATGEFASIMAPYIPPSVTEWLALHITEPVGVVIDNSLSVEGACADAKATGNAIKENKSNIDIIMPNTIEFKEGETLAYTNNEAGAGWRYVNNAYEKVSTSGTSLFHIVTYPVEPNKYYRVTGCLYAPQFPVCVFGNVNGDAIGSSPVPTDVTPQYYRMVKTIDVKTPADCQYLYVNMIDLAVFSIVKELEPIDTFNSALTPMPSVHLTVDTREDGGAWRYVNGNYEKQVTSGFSNWHIDNYKVKGNTYYLISGSNIIYVPTVIAFNFEGSALTYFNLDNNLGYDPINHTILIKTPIECENIAVNTFNLGLDSIVWECDFESSYFKRWKDKKWCVIGDSLTASNSTAIKKYFDYIFESTGIEVENYGKGGTGYANPNGANGNFIDRMDDIPTDCDVYTIFGSFNDVAYGRSNNIDIGLPSDTGNTTMCGYFNSAFDALYARIPLANVGVIAPCPWRYCNRVVTGANEIYASNYADALEAVCKRRSIPYLNLYDESGMRPWDDDFRLLMYTHSSDDGVHPNELGHEKLSTKIRLFLESLMLK